MHLESIHIKNFRSLRDLRVDLQPGLSVLVGRNNTGKSNILQAIRHALGPAASRPDSLWLERDDFYRAASNVDPEATMAVTLTFAGLSDAQRAHFFEIVDFDLSNLDNSKAIVRFEASWPKGKKRPSIRRTGGPVTTEPPDVPTNLLESLPVTFLPALRDAEIALSPGQRSRVAMLLRDLTDRDASGARDEIVDIFEKANCELTALPLVRRTADSLVARTRTIAGSDHSPSTIKAADADFERILRSLHLHMTDSPIGSLSANGLGFNNLLYIAVVLEHLKQDSVDECPLLLVEEPEAHLHPQLTELLADYLATTMPGPSTPQTLVTTHSPTVAASVPPSRVRVLYTVRPAGTPRCNSLHRAGMALKEERSLQRMMDVTRASLYFAKGAILVEGISELLLIPVLATRLDYDLAKEHISVIPICGVAFETFKKVLAPEALGIPVAIVSDADPTIKRGDTWESDEPTREGDSFKRCDRLNRLLARFAKHPTVRVFHSKLTLEYDLADAADKNADIMARAWESCFEGKPGTFNAERVAEAGHGNADRAMAAWRGICCAKHSGSKAEFAHRLAERLDPMNSEDQDAAFFRVPEYIHDAVRYVVEALGPNPQATNRAKP